MHQQCCNNAKPLLNIAKIMYFNLQRILNMLNFIRSLSHSQPACHKTRQHQAQGSSFFSKSMYIVGGFTNLLFRRRFIHCAMVFPFIPYYLAFFSKKVRTHKNVSIGVQLCIINLNALVVSTLYTVNGRLLTCSMFSCY